MARDDHHSLSVRTKRKSAPVASSNVSSSKRRRREAPAPAPVSSAVSKPRPSRRATPINPSKPSLSIASTRSNVTDFQLKLKKKKKKTVEPMTLFSRYADPSVQSPAFRPLDSNDNATRATLLEEHRRPRCHQEDTEKNTVLLASNGDMEKVVDLTVVEHVSRLAMVEGDDILQTLMRTSTPRVKRRFPSEVALTDSEQRDRDVLRRRRLKLRNQFSVMKKEEPHATGCLGGPEVEGCLFKENLAQTGRVQFEGETVERAEDMARTHLIEDEVETDEETTESKIKRLSKVMHMNWRQYLFWLVSGAMLLCAMVVAAPFVKKLMEPPLPYCDSEWIEVGDGSYVLADPADTFDRSKALQPFISTTSVATRASQPVCQPCPVYGNCLNGSVISCAPPYELQYGLCKENPKLQANLDQLALSIQKFIIEKAAKNACDNVSLWSYFNSDSGVEPTVNVTASIAVRLSDVQNFAKERVLFGKAVSNLSREYVFNRALDMALRALVDIYVTEDQSQLVVGRNVVPWSCRAKHQLYAHIKLIVLAVAFGTVLVCANRQLLLYRTERQLVDRFVKEVRFFLLDRTRRPDRFYPANHLRDDLFEKQSLPDRKWLCKSVWPRVAAVVKDDSRIRMRVMRVQGEDMVVWEWASSSAPTYRRAGSNRGRGLRTVATLQQESAGDARPVPSRRRKKDSRMSLP
ncbi:hypothetical protein DD238_007228 [Peronospora effusa]|uniref:Man1/Src1-like C-terminal domain-containing protein n=1 Tax=Peronospora effusa TaxID=542832 RepID=A0A3M6VFX9_9STRA|nr:hypothetical protein DD238_007228 [Peronospora effusa]